jgi:hypothetical protein
MLRAFQGFLFASSIGLLVFLCMCFISVSHAAEYPTKTIQIINPFPPGAVTDILARLVNDKLSSLLGQPVVVVNKNGGGGAVGIKAVKDAPADGYMTLIAPPPIALIPLARKDIGVTLLRRVGFDGAPFLLALVLGPMMENSLRQSLLISRGSCTIFFTRPVSAVLMVLTLAFLNLSHPRIEDKEAKARCRNGRVRVSYPKLRLGSRH